MGLRGACHFVHITFMTAFSTRYNHVHKNYHANNPLVETIPGSKGSNVGYVVVALGSNPRRLRGATLLALGSDAAVLADRSSTALLAPVSQAAVLADPSTGALLAVVPVPGFAVHALPTR